MNDMYKDDPSSWFIQTRSSRSCHPRFPLARPGSFNAGSNQISTSLMTIPEDDIFETETDYLIRATSVHSDSRTKKRFLVSLHGAICDKLKEMKSCIMKKTANSFLRQKNNCCWMKCFRPEVRQVAPVQDESSENNWVPDLNELLRWKEMADRVRCPLHKAQSRRLHQSGLED